MSKDWPEFYNYWDNRYKVGKIKFIDDRRNHPHRQFFSNWVISSPHIKSILEVGPGEMIEYQFISKKRKDIKYSICDVSDIFLNNCKINYPEVDTYKLPIEKLDSFENKKFDCIYQCSVFEHSVNIKDAIRSCIFSSKEFHFVLFKWKFSGGGLKSNFYSNKNLYSTSFNIWDLINEIKKYAIIDYTKVCMIDTGRLVNFNDFARNKHGNHRDGNYLMIHGKQR